jgi:hypothetical protein
VRDETRNKVGNVRVLKDILLSFALFRITTRRREGRGVVGLVGNHIAVSNVSGAEHGEGMQGGGGVLVT